MDVRCERCGTSYALDETRLGEGGARVRCARCGHVFLVQRAGEKPGARAAPASRVGEPVRREWKVRTRNGAISALRELTTLQRWIVEGKLEREDEIGLDGESWKRLASIPDLEVFFAAADAVAQRSASPPPTPPPAPTQTPPPLSAPEAVPAPPPSPVPAAASTGVTSARRRPTDPALAEPAFTKRAGLGVAPADDWEPPRLRRGMGVWLVLALVLAALGGAAAFAYLQFWQPAQLRAREEQARNAQLEKDQRDREERQRAAEQRAKEELLRAMAVTEGRDAGPPAPPDAGAAPRGSLEGTPGVPGIAPPAGTAMPARTGVGLPAEPVEAAPAGEGGDAAVAAPPAAPAVPRGPPQTYEDWMAEGNRRRNHERAAAALAAYDRALALRPGRSDAHAGRGLALLDLGRRSDALAEFERALELDPRDGIAVLGMAETYRSLGRTEEARRAYQRYLAGWPGGSEARAARAALESLKE